MSQHVAAAWDRPSVSIADFERRARAALNLKLPADALDIGSAAVLGDHRLDGLPPRRTPPRTAAVLIAVIDRHAEPTVLLTLRTAGLRDHSGQIALPGGKIDATDASPADAALREAWEEVGLQPNRVRPVGYLPPYLTGTGFLIVPTVALVDDPGELVANPREVAEVFEVPLGFLMDAANHQTGRREFNGQMRSFYVMTHLERRIWGVTAGVLRSLYDRLYG